MCIRDRLGPVVANRSRIAILIDNLDKGWERSADLNVLSDLLLGLCLLYTSDAADERSSVDLGGRRIIKKKNRIDQLCRLDW